MNNNKPKTCMTDGSQIDPDHIEINPETGMQKGYVVLCPEERSKGFVRPVRKTYKHIGIQPKYPTRELTEEEHKDYDKFNYILFEIYPESKSPVTGKFWTKNELNSGCGSITTMNISLAETYARNPKFYSGTFCCSCGKHFPVSEFVWDGTDERVGT